MLMFLMGLYNEAARPPSMFTADSSDFSAFLMMGEALRKVGNFEIHPDPGRRCPRFPKETQLRPSLQYIQLDGQHLAAARLFERSTRSASWPLKRRIGIGWPEDTRCAEMER